jgi:hypothetical protein
MRADSFQNAFKDPRRTGGWLCQRARLFGVRPRNDSLKPVCAYPCRVPGSDDSRSRRHEKRVLMNIVNDQIRDDCCEGSGCRRGKQDRSPACGKSMKRNERGDALLAYPSLSCAAGNRISTFRPQPFWPSSKRIAALCIAAISCTIARPRPLPSALTCCAEAAR